PAEPGEGLARDPRLSRCRADAPGLHDGQVTIRNALVRRESMKVFLTGASGYAGFHAALALTAAGYAVTGVVRRPDTPRLEFLRMQQIKLIRGDVAEPDSYAPSWSSATRSSIPCWTRSAISRPTAPSLRSSNPCPSG